MPQKSAMRVERGEAITARRHRLRVLGACAPGAAWLVLFFAVPLLLIIGVSFLSRGSYGTVE